MKRTHLLSLTAVLLTACILMAGCHGLFPTATQIPPTVQPTVALPTATPTIVPTPTAQPTPAPLFTADDIDFYILEDVAEQSLGAEVSLYHELVDAIMARQSVLLLHGSSRGEDVLAMFEHYNPLRILIDYQDCGIDDTAIYLTYAYSSEDHQVIIDFFREEYAQILQSIIKEDYNDMEKILAVYQYFASRFSYDYTYDPEPGIDIEVYTALKNGKAVCHTFARACKFALYQLGIDAVEVRGFTISDDYHEWFAAKIDGNWYHFDPTFENGANGGFGLQYFAMTDEDRANYAEVPSPYTTGVSPWDDNVSATYRDRFGIFRDVFQWQWVEGEDHVIFLNYWDGTTARYNTQTSTLSDVKKPK